jgi:hypothetical protein
MATPTTLPAAFVAGQVLTAAQQNALRGAFRVLQVVSATTATEVSSSVTSYVDTGLTATITPSSTTSKILVFANHLENYKTSGSTNNAINLKLLRDATTLVTTDSIGSTNSTQNLVFSTQIMWFDSPSSTSAVVYKTQFANATASAAVRVQAFSVPSSIILMEISA